MSKLLKLLRDLEWSAEADCAPYSMGGDSPYSLPACPKCGGVKPVSNAEAEFTKEAIGHKKNCILAKELKLLGESSCPKSR